MYPVLNYSSLAILKTQVYFINNPMRFKDYLNEYDVALAEACRLYENAGMAAPANPAMAQADPATPQAGSTQQNVEYGLEAIKLALDVWGLEPTTGWIGDAASGTISLGQAIHKAVTRQPGAANHLVDAAISAVSIIPFGDLAKLLKVKYGAKYGRLAIQFARPLKAAAATAKTARTANRTATVASGPLGRKGVDMAQVAGRMMPQAVS